MADRVGGGSLPTLRPIAAAVAAVALIAPAVPLLIPDWITAKSGRWRHVAPAAVAIAICAREGGVEEWRRGGGEEWRGRSGEGGKTNVERGCGGLHWRRVGAKRELKLHRS